MQSALHKDINSLYFYEALFNHASMGIIVTNHSAEILSANPFALHLFGYSEEEIIGKPIEILIPKRYQHNHVERRNTYLNNPKSRPMGMGMDLFAMKKDGTEFPVEVSLGNYSHNGEASAIAFVNDISIRKKVEAEIEKLNDELEATVALRTKELTDTMHQLEQSKEELSKTLEKEKELNELKSRFVSMASHEFRTPLSTILSSTYLIEKYTNTDEQPKREKHLQRIISSVEMLTDTLNDFLSVGKIEEGKIQVRLSYFDLQSVITTILEDIKGILKKQQKITYQHSGAENVLLDSSLLKHIIMNLVSNASKFSPENGVIEIKTENQPSCVILSVKDYGIGISKEDQKHLMERFFRGANASNIQGTGLGLHIVSKYAELMNGTMEYKSALEEGTEFIIKFKIN